MPEFARILAESEPETVAIQDLDRGFGWSEIDKILNRCANQLLNLDLGKKRRVAVFAENSCETAFCHLSGLISSSSTVPVNFHLTAKEAAYILSDSESRIVFSGPETIDRAIEAAAIAEIDTVITWGENIPSESTHWLDWLSEGDDAEPPTNIKPRANLLYTSGTTGFPKGTELPPTMFAGGDTISEHLKALAKNRFTEFGTHLVVGPMYHTGPLNGIRLLATGTPMIILGKFDPEKTLQTIATHKTESAVMVPTHFIRLLDLPDTIKNLYDVSSMKLVVHTGSSCPVNVKRAMIEWWGPIFIDAYGATEVGTTCSITSQEWLEHPGSVGQAVRPFEALILDENDNELPPNTEGRLCFRDKTGRGVIYPNDPEKTASSNIAPGIFTLGEIGYMDEDKFVYVSDRSSDMVISGGVNIYPAESEQILIEHPEVLDVACIGIPHREMGEELKALIEPVNPDSPPNPKELISYCRDRLSHYKCPRSVDFVENLGRTTMGKINKANLKAPYWKKETT